MPMFDEVLCNCEDCRRDRQYIAREEALDRKSDELLERYATIRDAPWFKAAYSGKRLNSTWEPVLDHVSDLEADLATRTAELDAARHQLRNLLAVVHRDGGHYADEHGLEKATADAMRLSSERIVAAEEFDAARARVGALEAADTKIIELLDGALVQCQGVTSGNVVHRMLAIAETIRAIVKCVRRRGNG